MHNSDTRSRKNIVVTYTKERIKFIFYQRFYKRSNFAQYSKLFQQSIKTYLAKNNGHLTIQQNHGQPFHQRNYGHCFDENDVSLFIVNLNWTMWLGRQTL